MRVTGWDNCLYVEWAEGRGRIVGYAPRGRGRKICAVILIKNRLCAVPLDELKVIRAPKK